MEASGGTLYASTSGNELAMLRAMLLNAVSYVRE